MSVPVFVLTLLFVFTSNAKVYFEDRFTEGNINKWEKSKYEESTLGVCEFAKPKDIFDEKEDGGIKTTQDARFYRYSAPLSTPFSNKDKTICVQFTVKHEQDIDCGGGYIKLLGDDFKPADFHGESAYEIMFGPDICGYDKKMVHVIFSYKGKNHLVKKDIPCKSDTLTHLYTLIVRPDNTFEVLVDQKSVENGSLVADFEMIPPKTIDDPEAKKPEDWVDEAEIPDPDDKKPDDWDQPQTIVDKDAKQPEDWNEETDGEWTPPMIDNPDFKGEWHPKMIPNPAYKGEWKPPQIPNPDFFEDPMLYARSFAHIGLDLWQVKSGTIFDNFIISDDVSECQAHGEYWRKRFDFEEELEKKKLEEKQKTPASDEIPSDEADDDEAESEDSDEKDADEFPEKDESESSAKEEDEISAKEEGESSSKDEL